MPRKPVEYKVIYEFDGKEVTRDEFIKLERDAYDRRHGFGKYEKKEA